MFLILRRIEQDMEINLCMTARKVHIVVRF